MPVWTDNPATSSTHIRAIHVNELRAAVDRNRAKLSLAPWPWTDDPVTSSTHMRAAHFTELKSAIQDLWTYHGQGTLPNWSVGSDPSSSRQISARDVNDLRSWMDQTDPDSIIGASWINNTRSFVGPSGTKNGWDVQLVYATNPSSGYDITTVGGRVQASIQAGRRVLVRVDYAGPDPTTGTSQSVPPDDASRTAYMSFLKSLSQSGLYQNVSGYIIGNEYNRSAESSGGTPVAPGWYARVFNGYGVDPSDTGNAHQVIHTYQAGAWVLVGPVGPYVPDADSPSTPWTVPAPWLDYFNGVCTYVYHGAAAKGIGVDGFALHAYGRPDQVPPGVSPSNEPSTNIAHFFPGYPDAEAGFRVYQQWQEIVDQYNSAVNLWVTETNTDTDYPSAQSYPSGWFLNALSELHNASLRYVALCWFVDQHLGGPWGQDALTDPQGNCVQANSDFNTALTTLDY